MSTAGAVLSMRATCKHPRSDCSKPRCCRISDHGAFLSLTLPLLHHALGVIVQRPPNRGMSVPRLTALVHAVQLRHVRALGVVSLAVGAGSLQLSSVAPRSPLLAPRRRAPPSNYRGASGSGRGASAALQVPPSMIMPARLPPLLAARRDVEAVPQDPLARQVEPGRGPLPRLASRFLGQVGLLPRELRRRQAVPRAMVPIQCLPAAAALVTLIVIPRNAAGQAHSTALPRSVAAQAKASVDPRPSSRALLASTHATIKANNSASPLIATVTTNSNPNSALARPALGATLT